MYKYILFDLDGTLTDPKEGITNSIKYALDKFGVEVKDKNELCQFIGPPLYDTFSGYYKMTDEQANKAIAYYREYFADKGIFENGVYYGVKEMLAELKRQNRVLALATSKPQQFAERILEHFDLAEYFDCVVGATMDKTRNKKADVIKYALEKLNVTDKSLVIMVGDRKHDLIGAREVGVDSIGVLYGYGSKEELENENPNYIVACTEQLLTIL